MKYIDDVLRYPNNEALATKALMKFLSTDQRLLRRSVYVIIPDFDRMLSTEYFISFISYDNNNTMDAARYPFF